MRRSTLERGAVQQSTGMRMAARCTRASQTRRAPPPHRALQRGGMRSRWQREPASAHRGRAWLSVRSKRGPPAWYAVEQQNPPVENAARHVATRSTARAAQAPISGTPWRSRTAVRWQPSFAAIDRARARLRRPRLRLRHRRRGTRPSPSRRTSVSDAMRAARIAQSIAGATAQREAWPGTLRISAWLARLQPQRQ